MKKKQLYILSIFYLLLIASTFIYLKSESNLNTYQRATLQEGVDYTEDIVNDDLISKNRFINSLKNFIPIQQIKNYKRLSFIKSLSLQKQNELTNPKKKLLKNYNRISLIKKLEDFNESKNFWSSLFGYLIPIIILYLIYKKVVKKTRYENIVLIIFFSLILLTFVYYQLNESLINDIELKII